MKTENGFLLPKWKVKEYFKQANLREQGGLILTSHFCITASNVLYT